MRGSPIAPGRVAGWLDHLGFTPDLAALQAGPTRIGVDAASREQAAHQSALRLAADLGVEAVAFPGDHAGFIVEPAAFAERLHAVLGRR